ncbi:MAG TPA: NAD(P)-dependent oxidoreductase [Streptosporangiaceae bacterium]|nr:NAD(P)-dependent oxidoreductase [Streptosporangiaceae bacterium]
MILVTGGLGFIGAHTVRALAGLGQPCLALTRRPVHAPAPFGDLGDMVTVVQADPADLSSLRRVGDGPRISGIVHLAAPAPGPPGTRAAFVRTSITTLLNLLDAAVEWDVPRVSLASSVGVYQGVPDTPYREDARLRQLPVDPIPAAKNAAELFAAIVTQSAGPQVVNLRIATIWGPGNASRAPVVPNMVHAAVRGEPVRQPVYADDGADLCHAADCARAIALLQCADTLPHPTYNIGSGRPTSPAQVRDALSRIIPGAALGLTPGRDPGGPGHDSWLDITRLRHDTGYQPVYDLDRGLHEYVGWLRDGHPY